MRTKRFSQVITFLIFSFFLYQPPTYSQYAIQGHVFDSLHRKISYASVSIFKDSIQITGITTDSNGHYSLSALPKGSYRFLFSYASLAEQSILFFLSRDSVIDATLKNLNSPLNNVVVFGHKEFQQIAGRFIYTPSKATTEGLQALDLMRHIPLVKYDDKSDFFSIIGKKGTTIIINGKTSELPPQMIIDLLRSLPAENIKSIELITNPGSQYSANTTGGIININIKRQLYEGWQGNVSLQTIQGVYNATMLNGGLSYRKGKLGLQFTPSLSTQYNYYQSNTEMVFTRSNLLQTPVVDHFRRYQVLGSGLKIDYDIDDKNFISYSGWLSNVWGKTNSNTTTGFSKLGQPIPDSSETAPILGTDFYIYNFGNLNYHHNFDSANTHFLDLNIDYNQFYQDGKNQGSFNIINSNLAPQRVLQQYINDLPQNFWNLSEKLDYQTPFIKKTNLILGAQYSNTNVNDDLKYQNLIQGVYEADTTLSVKYTYKEQYYAGYFSLSKSFNSKWNASLGARVEGTHYATTTESKNNIQALDTSYYKLFPSGSVSYTLNDNNQFSLSYSKKITRPNIETLFPGRTYYSNVFFTQNNPFLQPIIFNNAELAYTFKGKYNFIFDYSNAQNASAQFVLPVIEDGTQKFNSATYNYGFYNSFDFTFNVAYSWFKDLWKPTINSVFDYTKSVGNTSDVSGTVSNYSVTIQLDNALYLSKKKKWTAFVTFNFTSPQKDISGKVENSLYPLTISLKKAYKRFGFYLIGSDIFNTGAIVNSNMYNNPLLQRNYSIQNNFTRSVIFRIRYLFGNNKLKTTKDRETANEEMRRRTN